MAFRIDWKKLEHQREYEKTHIYFVVSGDKDFDEHKMVFLPVGDVIGAVPARDVLFKACDTLLSKQVEKGMEITIVTSDNSGVDELAKQYAVEMDYDCTIVPTDWDGLGKRAGYQKNEDLLYEAGCRVHKAALIIWDGKNDMTRNMIYQAFCHSVNCRVYNYDSKRWLSIDEIKDIQYEEDRKKFLWRRNKNNEQ